MAWVWLAFFAVAAQAAETETRIVDVLTKSDVRTLPRLKPLPPGLPDPRDMPEDGEWQDKDRSYRRGTFLPRPLDLEIMDRIEVCEGYPALAQVHLDVLGDEHATQLEGVRQVTEAKCTIEKIDAQVARRTGDVSIWTAVLTGVGGLAVGALLSVFFLSR